MKSLSPCPVRSFRLAVRGRNISRISIRCLFAFLLVSATLALAQEATIVGTVTDPTGAAVPRVKVTIVNNDTGITRNLITGGDGQYVAPSLGIGHYSVRAEATGFKSGERQNVVLKDRKSVV